MSTYVFMKILESLPHRYHRGINVWCAAPQHSRVDYM